MLESNYRDSLKENSNFTKKEQIELKNKVSEAHKNFFKSITQVASPKQLIQQYGYVSDDFKADVTNILTDSNKLHVSFDEISNVSKFKLLFSSSKDEMINSLMESISENLVIGDSSPSSLAFSFDTISQSIINNHQEKPTQDIK